MNRNGKLGFKLKVQNKVASLEIYDAIGDFWGVTPADVSRQLRDAGEVEQINVFLNSPGGDAFDGIAIFNLLKNHPAPVHAFVMGLAASAASIITMAADRIVMERGAFLMIHNASGLAIGNASVMREMAGLLDKLDGQLAEIYVERSGQDRDQIQQWMDEETWFTAEEAIEAGLADEAQAAEEGQRAQVRQALGQQPFVYRNVPEEMKNIFVKPAAVIEPAAKANDIPSVDFGSLTERVEKLEILTSTIAAAQKRADAILRRV
ncbi:MAG TPA: Clp protease ClpP [Candidatus Sumerlaeota bacterium]|nr:Clp protease ClpP [Candidatus Sumerlaeota bacterium]HPK03644.1 Clp protease ClpP [Candidatus Sumerlaeota bacterium]